MNLFGILLNISYALAGYPLFFSSFEDVGESIVEREVQPFESADEKITEWLTSCWSDVFIIIKDMNPVDTADLYRLKRFAQQSKTIGSFVTDFPIQMNELADDISVHCKAPLKNIDIYATYPIEQELNQRRTFYVEFDSTDRVEKSQVLEKIMSRLTSPYITVIYTSSFGVQQPIFSAIEPDPKRELWTQHYMDVHGKKEFKKPVVEPMLDEEQRAARAQPRLTREKQKAQTRARQYKEYLSDDTFAILFMIGVLLMSVMLVWNALFARSVQPQPKHPKVVVTKDISKSMSKDSDDRIKSIEKSTATTTGSES